MTNDDLPRYSAPLHAAEAREFLPFVHELAAVSAGVIRRWFMNPATAVELKGDDTPVTAADRRAEEVMRLLIERRYADHGVLGEEYGERLPDARYRWVLDPIDGTKAFVSHCYGFGTLIALLRDGRPILGAISHPVSGDVLVGEGGGATRLGERTVHVRPCARIEDATLLTTSHYEMLARPDGAAFDALARRARLYRSWGDCHGYFQLATGGADLMTDPALKAWDICALVPVVEGAGGRVSALDGGDPLQASDLLASAGGALHEAVLAALAGARAQARPA
jgi:histidinol phosphatase-like enzyme (inositol monophosphatase family)